MPTPTAPVVLPDDASPEALLRTVFAISPMGLLLLRPVAAEPNELTSIVDFTWDYLNPAAQQMLRLPERPAESFLTLFPTAQAAGVFGFYREAYLSGQVERRDNLYQFDGLDGYYRLVAQRQGPLLVVSFTDTNHEPRSAVEDALRGSQTRELQARADAETAQAKAETAQATAETAQAEAERQRTLLYQVLRQAPAYVATFTGPTHVYSFLNEPFRQVLTQGRAQVGQAFADLFPELVAQGFLDVLDSVYNTGQDFDVPEARVVQRDPQTGQERTNYVHVLYKPLRDAQGNTQGILAFATDMTEQVLARQQLEQLNQQLEARVQERTQELSEQQALLGRILGQVPAAVATLHGPDHRYSFFNEQYQQLAHGRAAYGVAMAEAVPEATAQGFVALLDQVHRTGQPFVGNELPIELRQPDGTLAEHYFNFVFQPLQDAENRVHDILAFAVDVSEQVRVRRQAEALQAELLAAARHQAAERETVYQVFTQVPPAVAILRGPEHRFAYVNPAYQHFFGEVPLLGRTVAEVAAGMTDPQYLTLLDDVYQTGRVAQGHEAPVQLPDPDGGIPRPAYFNFTYSPYQEDGRLVGICIFAYEVTEQVRARQQADAAAAELALLTAHAPAFLFRTDAAGSLVYLNRSFFEWTGLDAARLGSLDEGWATVHPGDLAVQQLGFVAAVQAGEPWQSTPYRFRRHDGQYRWMLSRSQPLFGPEGQVLGHTGLTVEMHEQVELQQQLARTNVDLDNFIYTASHDLKAPITNIEGLLMALEHELPEAGRTGDVSLMLEMMQGAIDRFRRTILHLTDLSRLQKEHNPNADAVALAPVVEAVRLDILPLLTQTQGQLRVTVPQDLTITFAEKNLRSVVYNLLSNAFKYRHPDRVPEVQLRAFVTDEYVVLEVADNGLGLDLAQGQERLFGMFQRLHTHVEGTGVGLYMVKRILENAGGRIEVSSQLGEGTTFRVYFRR